LKKKREERFASRSFISVDNQSCVRRR
jgi:hypothetical protein